MSNSLRGQSTFTSAGRSFTFCLSVNAICALEDHFEKGIAAIGAMMADPANLRFGTMRAVFWAGLRDHHAELTLEDAGRVMSEMGIPEATDLIGKSFALAFPEVAGPLAKGQDSKSPKRAGTGKGS